MSDPSEKPSSNQRWRPLLLLAFALVSFSINIGGYDLWPADEPRYGEVAREILESGDWLVMHVNGEPYNEKPPMLFWSIAALSKPFGFVSEITARAPSVIAGLIVLVMTWLLALRMYGRRTAFWSVLILITCARFWWQARCAQTDMLLTAFLSVALYALWRWHEDRRAGWLVLLYGAVGLGLLTKGPPALVFPLLCIVTFYWGKKAERRRTHYAIGVLAAIAFVALWLIPARMAASDQAPAAADAVIAGDLFRQTIGRFFLGVSKAQWPWYYLVNLPVDWMPWSLFLPWIAVDVWRRRREDERMRILLRWCVPAFIVFSISIGKRAIYLLPLYPALAILVAGSILRLMDSDHAAWRRRTALAWVGVLLVLGVAPLVVPWTEFASSWSLMLGALSVAAFVFAIYSAYLAFTTPANRLHGAMAAQFGVLCVLIAVVVFPLINEHKSAREFCAPIRNQVLKGGEPRVYSLCFSREEYIFYANRFHTPILTDLLPLEGVELDAMDAAKAQLRVRKALMKAVEDVPIADFGAVTDEEMTALAAALREGEQELNIEPALLNAVEDALRTAIKEFMAEFQRPGGAFAIVQEEDFRWLLPFAPEMRVWRLIKAQPVGSRQVLLFTPSPIRV